MVILLYGPDTYRSRQKLNEIVEHYKKTSKSRLNLIYGNTFEELEQELKLTSMFFGKKLIVLKNAFQNSEFKEKFKGLSKELSKSEHIILFFEEGNVVPKLPGIKSQKFEFLQGLELKKWIKGEFDGYNAKPSQQAVEKLIAFVGADSWRLANEIKKLVSFKKSSRVETEDVELLVRPKIEVDIFKTIDAISAKNKKQALSLLRKHLQKGDSPLYLLTMINYQFRNLLLVKSSKIAHLKLHPYVIRKSLEQARKFSFEELKKIYHKIFEADLNIKTGKIEPETALDLLISEI